MNSLGICIGASTLSMVMLTRDTSGQIRPLSVHVRPHYGNPREAFSRSIRELPVQDFTGIAVTGRKFRHLVNLSTISEPEAVECALTHLNGTDHPVDVVISAGGETFMVYVLDREGRICTVRTGNKCASGTGEFYVQQLRRIDLSLDQAAELARDDKPYMVSGRCSVFCKSDCTHAMNKGVPKGRIAAGLSKMMAGKILEITKQLSGKHMLLIGGASRNAMMVEYLKKDLPALTIPPEAPYFEALGSALWALDHETATMPAPQHLFNGRSGSFFLLPPLNQFEHLVDYRTTSQKEARQGDRCILGLDVGSTTTKAVILRMEDNRVLASIYLRTNGNPVASSRACYGRLADQLNGLADDIRIVGMGVTGSGRQIAGLHAMTSGIINEIIAHATGALFYDENVDTLFEIGGQDAKYTFIKNGIPSDYAMNDACSAGTGSFLEEAAKETMDMKMEDIGPLALQGATPPNFNDQCSAFISSDIKNAFHDSMKKEDVLAGLVYSVCMNYNNRVKGNRPVGERIFMQGGVCYNRAVPAAMASLTGKKIIVPPEPGLMGAFGVALEIKHLLSRGLMVEKDFSLPALRDRELEYDPPFVCHGGKENCDRKCEIARIRIEDRVYPFGGICNRWYNSRFHVEVDSEKLNLVHLHEKLIFRHEGTRQEKIPGETVGISRSFLVNSYFPLYRSFFTHLGFTVMLSDQPANEGIERKLAPFCYPAEIAHGYFYDLLEKRPDFLFLPHMKGAYVEEGAEKSTTCPLSQGEPYYLASAFKDHDHLQKLQAARKILNPVIDFSEGIKGAEKAFTDMAKPLERKKQEVRKAFAEAVREQEKTREEIKAIGRRFLAELENETNRQAVVVFGRSYNAYASQLNMGIPDKFASRGIPVIPVDFLPLEEESAADNMYWSTGQVIQRGAAFVRKHPQLFGCYITNFSCGPDSFLLSYFRNEMGRKPFLILELDSHVADAGLETRIEAFLDIVGNYKKLEVKPTDQPLIAKGHGQTHFDAESQTFSDSQGERYPLNHPRVHVIFPAMAPLLLDLVAAVFRSQGIRATALPPPDEEVVKLGQGHTTGKECLPLQLTVGSLLKYLKYRKDPDERLLYFMPTTSGPCRFGQYAPFISQLLSRLSIENVALLSLQSENGYDSLGDQAFTLKIWSCLVIADIMADIHAVLLANAVDHSSAMAVYQSEVDRITKAIENSGRYESMKSVLSTVADHLSRIPVKRSLAETPFLLLTGEIFVRHENLSRQYLVERLADQGFATKTSSVMEWIYYTDWCYRNDLAAEKPSALERISLLIKSRWMKRYESQFKRIMARSNLFPYRLENVPHILNNARHLLNPALTGEAVLTIGASISEILDHYCGVIAIGPFGCMPNRLAESILTKEMNRETISSLKDRPAIDHVSDIIQEFPFLAIESDGKPFPQIITAKIEVFLLQAKRVHQAMMAARASVQNSAAQA